MTKRKAKDEGRGGDLVTVSFRVQREDLEAFREIARAEHRPVAAEARRLFLQHIGRAA